MAKHSNDILTWARRGAEVRWNELQAEVVSLLKAFPDLATLSNTARRTIAKSARGECGRTQTQTLEDVRSAAEGRQREDEKVLGREAQIDGEQVLEAL